MKPAETVELKPSMGFLFCFCISSPAVSTRDDMINDKYMVQQLFKELSSKAQDGLCSTFSNEKTHNSSHKHLLWFVFWTPESDAGVLVSDRLICQPGWFLALVGLPEVVLLPNAFSKIYWQPCQWIMDICWCQKNVSLNFFFGFTWCTCIRIMFY